MAGFLSVCGYLTTFFVPRVCGEYVQEEASHFIFSGGATARMFDPNLGGIAAAMVFRWSAGALAI
jgi:hypothetical protein